MTQDTKAPERIMAWPENAQDWTHAFCSDVLMGPETGGQEYARLDLLTAAEARVEEARALALEEALNKVSGCDRVSEVGPAIRALMDTTHAEVLERVRTEEREACAKVAEALNPEKPTSYLHRRENIAAAIRARGKS